MHTVRTGPLIGLAAQVILLAALTMSTGLGTAAWLTGLAYGVVVTAVLSVGLSRAGALALGPADRVTLARATLVGGVSALVVEGFARPVPALLLGALTAVALALDAVDGKVARHTGTVSALGARFDMEVDAFLLLVLSGYAARSLGLWVLAIGAMRYGYVAAMWVLPWMRSTLPYRYWRKVVAATQGVVLAVVVAGVLPHWLAFAAALTALVLLGESFARDVAWQWRHRVPEPVPAFATIRR